MGVVGIRDLCKWQQHTASVRLSPALSPQSPAPAIYAGSLLTEQSIRGRNSPSALMPACPCAFSITCLSAPTAHLPLLGELEVTNRGAVGQGE